MMNTRSSSFLRDVGIALLLILFGVVSRWLPHPANVAPIAAITLVSMVYLDKRIALLVPLTSMVVSDMLIGFYGVQMAFVYGSYLLIAGLGLFVRRNPRWWKVVGASFTGAVLFFLITNYAVWQFGSMYTKDAAGLVECYTLALPFFRNTLAGDLFYTGAMMVMIRLLQHANLRSLLFLHVKRDIVLHDAQ